MFQNLEYFADELHTFRKPLPVDEKYAEKVSAIHVKYSLHKLKKCLSLCHSSHRENPSISMFQMVKYFTELLDNFRKSFFINDKCGEKVSVIYSKYSLHKFEKCLSHMLCMGHTIHELECSKTFNILFIYFILSGNF